MASKMEDAERVLLHIGCDLMPSKCDYVNTNDLERPEKLK